jgi:hypothetical protein
MKYEVFHTSYFILHTSYFILHTSYFILHTSYFILHTSYFIPPLKPPFFHRNRDRLSAGSDVEFFVNIVNVFANCVGANV